MTYNVFGGMLNLAQSINHCGSVTGLKHNPYDQAPFSTLTLLAGSYDP